MRSISKDVLKQDEWDEDEIVKRAEWLYDNGWIFVVGMGLQRYNI